MLLPAIGANQVITRILENVILAQVLPHIATVALKRLAVDVQADFTSKALSVGSVSVTVALALTIQLAVLAISFMSTKQISKNVSSFHSGKEHSFT